MTAIQLADGLRKWASSAAVDGDVQGLVDLTHTRCGQPTQAVHEDRDGRALDGVQIDC